MEWKKKNKELFLFVNSNLFSDYNSFIQRLNHLKIYDILINGSSVLFTLLFLLFD